MNNWIATTILLIAISSVTGCSENSRTTESRTVVYIPELITDSASVYITFHHDEDTTIRAFPDCLCTETKNGIKIAHRDYRGFELDYLTTTIDSGKVSSEFISNADFRRTYKSNPHFIDLKLNKKSYEVGDTLVGKMDIEGHLIYEIEPFDSVFYSLTAIIKCHIRDSAFTYKQLDTEREINYIKRRLVDFKNLANSDSASNMKELALRGMDLKRIPEEVKNFTSLTTLDLRYNDIKVIDMGIMAKLPQLKTLLLNNNEITIIPNAIDKLKNLEEFNVSSNPIAVLPPAFYRLPSLKTVELSLTEITEISPDVGGMTSLENLDLSSMYELKSIPKEVFSLSQLRKLWLHHEMTEFPFSQWKPDSLEFLYIRYDALEANHWLLERFKKLDVLFLNFEVYEHENSHKLTYEAGLWLEKELPGISITKSTNLKKKSN